MTFEPMHDISRDRLYTELLTPERFIEMYRNDRDNIEWARPIPAPLGSRVLGYILVRKKRPNYPPLPPRRK